MTTPVNVTVTGAAGQIGYSLLFRIASGDLFGPNVPVALHLLEIEPAMKALHGVVMELDDCAFPLLTSIEATSDLNYAFDGTNWALLVGSCRARPAWSAAICSASTEASSSPRVEAIAGNAASDVRVLVVGQPVQHELSHRTIQRDRGARRPLVRDDAPRPEPRRGPTGSNGRTSGRPT